MRYLVILLIVLVIPSIAFSATINIPADYPTIQEGIDAAVNGDIVLVAPGTYVENINFKGKAITVTSEQGADGTIIDGNQAGSVVKCESGEGLDSVLDGFTITNGSGKSLPPYGYTYGGGMFNEDSSLTVTNCTFTGNSADWGGGMCNSSSSPTVTECTFFGNSVSGWPGSHGGGMYNDNSSSPTVTNCTFFGNSVSGWPGNYGGGMCNLDDSSPTVINCTFSGNSATYGGGMYNGWDSSPTVTNSTFCGNGAWGGGGMDNVGSGTTVTNCTFSGNSAANGGGMVNGYGSTTVANCTFSGNSATGGGGMYNVCSSPVVANCTFSGNHGGGGGMGNYQSSPRVTNTILWNNDAPEIWIGDSSNPSTLTISYSDVKGGKSSVYVDPGCTLNWGKGMIDADPLWIDPANDDFHLTFNSPCRGSGDNTAVLDLYDFEGDPRIAYGTVDMGADEFYTHLYYTGDATPGGNVELKFVGLPGTNPVVLWVGSDVLGAPIPTMYGDWYLDFPILLTLELGPIFTPEGVSVLPYTFDPLFPVMYIPMQSLIGMELTNLCVMEVTE